MPACGLHHCDVSSSGIGISSNSSSISSSILNNLEFLISFVSCACYTEGGIK